MRVRLTERDGRVLAKLVPARWLTTRQIRRLFFSSASLSATRRRLRKLVAAQYLRTYREHRMAESLYTLGPNGEVIVEEKGLDVRREPTHRKQFEHFVGINDLRVAVECSSGPVVYFFAAWELPSLGWSDRLVPDAIFALDDGKRRTFLAEYDRSNEPVREFVKKLRLYHEGLRSFRFDAALVLTKTRRRIVSLRRHLQGRGLPHSRYLATTIWEIVDGDLRSRAFVDLAAAEGEPEAIFLSNVSAEKCSLDVFSRGNSFK